MASSFGCRVCSAHVKKAVSCSYNGSIWWECPQCNATRAGERGTLQRVLERLAKQGPKKRAHLLARLPPGLLLRVQELVGEALDLRLATVLPPPEAETL